MRTLLILLKKDYANFIRDKAAVSLTFLVPVVLIYIFGHVFGLNSKSTGPNGIRLAVINQSSEPAALKLVAALKAEKSFRVVTQRVLPDKSQRPLTEADVREMMQTGNQLRFAVVIPVDVIRDDAIGIRIKILSNPANDVETQMVNGLLQKTIFSSVPELLGQSLQAQARKQIGAARLERFNTGMATLIAVAFDGDQAAIQRSLESGSFGLDQLGDPAPAAGGAPAKAGTAANALGNIVKIESETVVGANVKSPEATRLVGGWAMMFLLFALSGSASAFFDEKKSGIFQRVLAAPVNRTQLLWSRFLWGVLLGLVQLTTLFMAGRLLYGIDVFGNFGNLVVVCVAAAAACTAFGMLLVSITPSSAAASGLATFLILTLSACGGAWFPLTMMPLFMQEIAKLSLVYWALEGFRQVLWAGHSFLQILPTVGVLLGIAAGVMGLAVWRFGRNRMLE